MDALPYKRDIEGAVDMSVSFESVSDLATYIKANETALPHLKLEEMILTTYCKYQQIKTTGHLIVQSILSGQNTAQTTMIGSCWKWHFPDFKNVVTFSKK